MPYHLPAYYETHYTRTCYTVSHSRLFIFSEVVAHTQHDRTHLSCSHRSKLTIDERYTVERVIHFVVIWIFLTGTGK